MTQQLVQAINQIRDLLESLKRERKRSDQLAKKLEENENFVATVKIQLFFSL